MRPRIHCCVSRGPIGRPAKQRLTVLRPVSDIAVAFSCEYVLTKKVGTGLRQWPLLLSWLHMIEARPAYQLALKEGPKYDFCLLAK